MIMKTSNEYKGGLYALLEYVGLYIRYVWFKICCKKKTIEELAGEKDYPQIDLRQRILCLIVGAVTVLIISMFFFFGVSITFS